MKLKIKINQENDIKKRQSEQWKPSLVDEKN